MKIYIAGKITGLEYEDAEAAFVFAETVLEKAGHTPLNPMKLVDQFGPCAKCEHSQRIHMADDLGCHGNSMFCSCNTYDATEREWAEMLLDAITVMMTMAEGVYFLGNWRDSMGARIEHAIAVELKMPIFYAASELPVGSDWPEQSVSDVAAV